MGRRYHRRRRSSSIIRDILDILANSSWYMTLTWGAIFFILLYFVIPSWFQSQMDASSGNKFFPAVDYLIGRRIHWVQWIGIVTALIALYFSIRNYFLQKKPKYLEKGLIGFISRLIGREID